jgi:DNA repair protein RecO (recombination protein O)
MHIKTRAIICGVRHHAEQGAIVRVLTPDHGLLVGYVRGAHSRTMRPVLIAANEVEAQFSARNREQMPSLTIELIHSRGPLLGEALAAAGLDWATAIAAVGLPESHPYPHVFDALDGVIRAIEAAPSARRWVGALIQYEQLILGVAGFGRANDGGIPGASWTEMLRVLTMNGERFDKHLLAGQRIDILAARERLTERLKRAAA